MSCRSAACELRVHSVWKPARNVDLACPPPASSLPPVALTRAAGGLEIVLRVIFMSQTRRDEFLQVMTQAQAKLNANVDRALAGVVCMQAASHCQRAPRYELLCGGAPLIARVPNSSLRRRRAVSMRMLAEGSHVGDAAGHFAQAGHGDKSPTPAVTTALNRSAFAAISHGHSNGDASGALRTAASFAGPFGIGANGSASAAAHAAASAGTAPGGGRSVAASGNWHALVRQFSLGNAARAAAAAQNGAAHGANGELHS